MLGKRREQALPFSMPKKKSAKALEKGGELVRGDGKGGHTKIQQTKRHGL